MSYMNASILMRKRTYVVVNRGNKVDLSMEVYVYIVSSEYEYTRHFTTRNISSLNSLLPLHASLKYTIHTYIHTYILTSIDIETLIQLLCGYRRRSTSRLARGCPRAAANPRGETE